MTNNRYTFPVTLSGYIRLDKDDGKYNNRSFSFHIPGDVLSQIEKDRTALIEWVKTKNPNSRMVEGVPPWQEKGLVKYSYGEGDGSRKPKPAPVIVDTDGVPIDKATLASVREGTKANIILQQTPYALGTYNTSFRVLGLQIVELVTANAADSGRFSEEDIVKMFGTGVDGFKVGSPAVRDARPTEESGEDVGVTYDF